MAASQVKELTWKMKLWNRIKSSSFVIKLFNWEYWPFGVIYAPAFVYWLFLSAKARSLFFFSAANPGIATGGMLGESKIEILKKVPQALVPKTLYIKQGENLSQISVDLKQHQINFPLIAKPNIGSRGFLVKKIHNLTELQDYLSLQKVDFLVQEFVSFPMEVSVMYYRFPDQDQGAISSVTIKKYLAITGDGRSSIFELINKFERAKLQLDTLKITHANLMDQIPSAGEEVELVPIGNHCKGAAFFNGNHLIDLEMTTVFDKISHQLDGIYFGRFDLKCLNENSLKTGEHLKILEINGVGAEPAHIYDPSYSLLQAYKDIFKQWKVIYQISLFNKNRGQAFMSFKEAYKTLTDLTAYKKLARS